MEHVTPAELVYLDPALVAAPESSAHRRARVKLQLRDRHGRWIEMGGGLTFHMKANGGQAPVPVHGTVVGGDNATGQVHLRLENGAVVSVPAAKTEQAKAIIGLHPDAPAPGVTPNPVDPREEVHDVAPAPTPTSASSHAKDAAGFERWAKAERKRLREKNTIEPGRIKYSREDGARVSRIGTALEILTDTASDGFFGGYDALNHPLEDLLPDHPDLVREYQSSSRPQLGDYQAAPARRMITPEEIEAARNPYVLPPEPTPPPAPPAPPPIDWKSEGRRNEEERRAALTPEQRAAEDRVRDTPFTPFRGAPAAEPDHSALDALSRVGNGINPEFGRMIRAGIDRIKAGEDPAAVIQEMRDKVPDMLFARDHLRAKEALDKVEAAAIPGGTNDGVDSGSGYTSLYGDLLGAGLTPDAARQADDTLRRLHDTYGFQPDYVGTVSQVRARYPSLNREFSDTISATMGVDPETGKSFMGVNPDHLNDYAKILAEHGTPGWNTVPTLEGVITHEYGHLLDFKHPPGHDDDLAYQAIADRHFDGDVDKLQQALKSVSGYAGKHRNEAVAEAFAKYKHDPSSPDWLKDWGREMDRLWSRPAHTHDGPPPEPGFSRPEVARGSQNRPVVRADDKRATGGQTRTNFTNESTGAPMGKTETGDTFERLFDNVGKKLLESRFGKFKLVTGAEGGSRTTPLDLITTTHGAELKTMSSNSKNLKTAIKAEEIKRKLQAVGDANLKPLLLVQVVDQENHKVGLYGMENFGSKAVSKMEHFGDYSYTPEDFAAAQRAAGHDDKAVARAFQSMTPEQKAQHVAHVQRGVEPREAARRAYNPASDLQTGASTTGPEEGLSEPIPTSDLITPSDRVWTKQELDAIPMDEPTLNRDQREAISEYRLPDNAIAINDALRAGTPLSEVTDEWQEPGETPYQDMHDQLMSVSDASTLTAPLVSYRGMNIDHVPQPGETISQKGWSSATVNQEFARGVTDIGAVEGRAGGAHPVLLEINAPAGTHVINTHAADTGELIFPPDTPFQVHSVTTDPNGLVHVKASVPPPGVTPEAPPTTTTTSEPTPSEPLAGVTSLPQVNPAHDANSWLDDNADRLTEREYDELSRAIDDVDALYRKATRANWTPEQYQSEKAKIISDLRRLIPESSPSAPFVDRLVNMLEDRGFTAAVVAPPEPGDLVETNEELQTPDQPDNSGGVMVALKVPDPERYAVPGGTNPDDLHLTLAYLGQANEFSPEQKQGVLDAAQQAAQRFGRPPLALFPYDYGTFPGEAGEGSPFVLHPHGLDLDELHGHVCNSLKEHGLGDKISADHEFNPHVTVKYLPDGELTPHPGYTPPDMDETSFPHMRVSIGDDEHLIPFSEHPERPIRPQQVLFSVEDRMHDLVQAHNMTASRAHRASLPMLKAVYSRQFQDSAPSSSQTLTASALTRCETFLEALSSRDPRHPDSDLYPTRDGTNLFERSLTSSASLRSDRVKDLLMGSAVAADPGERNFHLARALAAAANSPSPKVALELTANIRTLLAVGGNSSAARSLRAKLQLRDRYGRWIEMGKGIRFKVHQPGSPGGGTWYHGIVEGTDVPNGNVSVRLEDGRLVQVPAAKVEQPQAIIGLRGQNKLPHTPADQLDPHAPTIAELPEVSAPVNAGHNVDPGDIRSVLSRVATRLHDDFRDSPEQHRTAVQRLQLAVQNAARDLNNPDPTVLDNAVSWIDQFLRDNPSLSRTGRDGLTYAQNSYRDMAQVLRQYQHDASQHQVQHHVQLPQEERRPFARFRNGRAQHDQQIQARHREIEDAGRMTDVRDLEVPRYEIPTGIAAPGDTRPATVQEIRDFLMQDYGIGVSFPPNEQGHAATDRLNLHGDRNRVKAALQEVWGLDMTDDGHVVPRQAADEAPDPNGSPFESIDAAAAALDQVSPILGMMSQALRETRQDMGSNPSTEQWADMADQLDGARQAISVIRGGVGENGLDEDLLAQAADALDAASTNAWDQARPQDRLSNQLAQARAAQAPAAPEAPDALHRAIQDRLNEALDALGEMEDAQVPIDTEAVRDHINDVLDSYQDGHYPLDELNSALSDVMGQFNLQFNDRDLIPESDLNPRQFEKYNNFVDMMGQARGLAGSDIEVPGSAEPSAPADDVHDDPQARDQFGNDVPAGFEFDQQIVGDGGAIVQLYHHTGSDGREYQVGVRRDRRGNQIYPVRVSSMMSGARRWSILNTQEDWNGVTDYFNEVEAGNEQRAQFAANRQRMQREQAQEVERAARDHSRRVAENVDDNNTPLPPGWSRHRDEDQGTYYQDGQGNVVFQLDDGLAAFAADPVVGGRRRIGIFDNWDETLASLNSHGREQQLRVRENLISLAERSNISLSDEEKQAIRDAPSSQDARDALNENESYRAMRARARDAGFADRMNQRERDATQQDRAFQAALRSLGNLQPAPEPNPEAHQNEDEAGRPLATGWRRAAGEEHSGEPIYEGPHGATAFVDQTRNNQPITLSFTAPGGGQQQVTGLSDWDEVQQILEQTFNPGTPSANGDQPVDLAEGARQRAERDRETGYRDSLFRNLVQIGVDEDRANRVMYIPSASDVRDYVSGMPEVRDLLAGVAEERSTDVAPIDQRNARLINNGLERLQDLGPDGNLLPSLTPGEAEPAPPEGDPGNPNDVPDSGAPPQAGPQQLGPDGAEDPLAPWERALLDAPIPDNAPNHPDDQGVAIAPEDQPARVGAPPGYETRYHPDGVITDRYGHEIRQGTRVVSRRDGVDVVGTVIAVQQQPPYARIVWPDGRRQVRAGGRLTVVETPDQAPAAQRAPVPQNPPPGPPSDLPEGDAISLLQDLANMHQAGADRAWPIVDKVATARQNVNNALSAIESGDRARVIREVTEAVSNYDDAIGSVGYNAAPRPYQDDVRRRMAAARDLLRKLGDDRFPLTPPDVRGAVSELQRIRQAIPLRVGRGGDMQYRNAGFALNDAILALQTGNLDGAEEPFRRAMYLLRQAGRGPLAEEIQQHLLTLRRANLQPGAQGLPGAPEAFGDAPEPRDFIANRFEGDRAPRAASPNTPGVVDPHDSPGNPPHPNAPNPNAVQADYVGWGPRAAEIAQAARVRPSITSISEAVNGNPVEFQQLVQSAFGGLPGTTFGRAGYTLDLSRANGSAGSLSIAFNINDANGNRVGSGSRSLTREPDGTWKAYNAGMSLNTDAQSTGFANALNRYFENFYIANGFSQVTVSASGGGGSTGGFAWAMNGFGFKNPASEVPSILDRLRRSARVNTPEARVVDQMRERVAQARNGRAEWPTPMELALVGWAPGKTSWLGKTTMTNNSWSGIKKLTPDNINWQQRQNYEIAKRAEERLANGENAFNVNRPFANSIGNMSAPGLREAGITPVEAEQISKIMRSQTPSAAVLPFTTKKKLNRWANDQIRAGNQSSDMENVAQITLREQMADYPNEDSLGVGQQLSGVDFNQLRNNSVPGWSIEQLGAEAGVNQTFRAVHQASGQTFFIKQDRGIVDRQNITSTGAEAEQDINALLRQMNWPGIDAAQAFHSDTAGDGMLYENPQDMRNAVLQHVVGDNLDLVARPNMFGTLSRDQANDAIRNLAQHDQLVRMALLDGLIGNQDRHYFNYMVGQGTDGRWWLFPIDHGLAKSVPDGAERLDPLAIIQHWHDNITYKNHFREALDEYMEARSEAHVRELLQSILNDYRAGVSTDPNLFEGQNFGRTIIQNIQLLESRMDELVRLFMGG